MAGDVIFSRATRGCFVISEQALASIEKYRQQSETAREAGGVLLGRLIVNAPDIVVDDVTEPSSSDRRGRFFFSRSAVPTQRAIDDAWQNSNGTRNYLGEWHTHPELDPSPSPTDFENWQRLSRRARYEQDSLFFVIAGMTEIRAWEIERQRSRPGCVIVAKLDRDDRETEP